MPSSSSEKTQKYRPWHDSFKTYNRSSLKDMSVKKTGSEATGGLGEKVSQVPSEFLGRPRDTALAKRIDAVYEDLSTIQVSVDNRITLIKAAKKDRLYFIEGNRNQVWKSKAEISNREFYALKNEVEAAGHRATKSTVQQWELRLKILQRQTLHYADWVHKKNCSAEWKEDAQGVFQASSWSWEKANSRPQSNEEGNQAPVSPKTQDMSPHDGNDTHRSGFRANVALDD